MLPLRKDLGWSQDVTCCVTLADPFTALVWLPQGLNRVPVGHTQGLARAQHTEGPPETQQAPYAGPGEELVVQD